MMQRKNKEQQRQAEYQLKISLLGDGAVGKVIISAFIVGLKLSKDLFIDQMVHRRVSWWIHSDRLNCLYYLLLMFRPVFDYQIDTFQSEDGTFKILYADTASREYYVTISEFFL